MEIISQKASVTFSGNQEIINEINRIKDVLEFSSFFRKTDCMQDLDMIKSSKEEKEILKLFKEIK